MKANINKTVALWGTPTKETEKAILIKTTLKEFSESKKKSDKQLNVYGDSEEYKNMYGVIWDSEIEYELWIPKSQIIDSLEHKVNKGFYIYLVNYFATKDKINIGGKTYILFPDYRENLDWFRNN